MEEVIALFATTQIKWIVILLSIDVIFGIIGALLIWTAIKIVFGLPGYPGLH